MRRIGHGQTSQSKIPSRRKMPGRLNCAFTSQIANLEIQARCQSPVKPGSSEEPAAQHQAQVHDQPISNARPELPRRQPAKKIIRLRDKEHRRFVARQPCLVCGRRPCDAHHLRFAQPRGLGLKVSDEFTVPLCRIHHREVHRVGNEAQWWEKIAADPLSVARALWLRTRPPTSEARQEGSATANNEPTRLSQRLRPQARMTKRSQFPWARNDLFPTSRSQSP